MSLLDHIRVEWIAFELVYSLFVLFTYFGVVRCVGRLVVSSCFDSFPRKTVIYLDFSWGKRLFIWIFLVRFSQTMELIFIFSDDFWVSPGKVRWYYLSCRVASKTTVPLNNYSTKVYIQYECYFLVFSFSFNSLTLVWCTICILKYYQSICFRFGRRLCRMRCTLNTPSLISWDSACHLSIKPIPGNFEAIHLKTLWNTVSLICTLLMFVYSTITQILRFRLDFFFFCSLQQYTGNIPFLFFLLCIWILFRYLSGKDEQFTFHSFIVDGAN